MAISKIQQTQISGSLSQDDTLAAGSGLAGKATLKGDLDAMRSQINRIVGKSAWYDALDGSQDLADVYAAMHASGSDAAFQGSISSVGAASIGGTLGVTGAATLGSSLSVAGVSTLTGTVDAGGAMYVAGEATLNGGINVESGKLRVLDGGEGVTMNGTLEVSGASRMIGALTVTGSVALASTLVAAGAATFNNGAAVNSALLDVNAGMTANEIKIDGDVAGRLYYVGSAGEIKDSGDLTFDGSKLDIVGSADIHGAMDVDSFYSSGAAGLSGSLAVAGAAGFADTLSVSGATTLSSTLSAGASTLASAVISGNASVGGLFGAAGAATLGSTLAVTGAATLSSTLSAGASTLASAAISGAATVGSTLGVTGAATFANNVGVVGALAVTGGTTLGGMATLDGGINVEGGRLAITDGGAGVSMNGTLAVSGASMLAGAVTANDAITVAGMATLNGGINVEGGRLAITDGGSTVTMNNNLSVAGQSALTTVEVSGQLNANSSATVAGNLSVLGSSAFASSVAMNYLSVTGSSGMSVSAGANIGGSLSLTGAASLGSTLAVVGATVLSSSLSAGASSLASAAIAGAASVGGTLGVTGAATFASSVSAASISASGNASVGGTLDVTGASSLAALSAAAISAASLSTAGTAQIGGVFYAQDAANFAGVADFNGGVTADSIAIDGDVAQRLYIVGASGEIKDESALTFNGSDLSITGGLRVSGNAQVDGDLLVKGAFTYIETENMKVKDAFLYLATGSNGSVDSGIILSKGAGGSYDLILGQDGGAGELVFAKVAHNASGDSPADINGASLVPAWMSSLKMGGAEGSLSGSLAAAAGGVRLSSEAGNFVAVDAAADLRFSANGNSAISFASSGQSPDASFVATTIVGMLNELRIDVDAGNAGGNLSKATYGAGDFSGNVLSFAGQQTLASANHKLVDVFLNGVFMSPGRDLTAISTTSVTFDASIVSALNSDDVIAIIARG